MKHTGFFDTFLQEQVNLNQSRLDRLKTSVGAITDLLKSKLKNYESVSPQGSYAHQTIIKPVQENDEFDADLLVYIEDENFSLEEYYDYPKDVYQLLKDNDNYKDKIRYGTRCVTIDYAGDFHLDIVPCIKHKDSFYICNRQDECYEKTDGDGYKDWLADKNKLSQGNYLRKATRLFKFLRDHKDNFTIKSILLTTLLGEYVNGSYNDLPSALKGLSNQINQFLQDHPEMPKIENPVLPGEDFNRNWTQKQYKNFRDKFDIYNTKINDAFDEKDHNASVKKWRALFGDEFGELKDQDNSGKKSSTSSAIGGSTGVAATKPYGDYDGVE
ncbi:MAG: hypothetical protein ISN29_03695 [Gammaproteobacteria bacterium AqS3]|nr:hypothetical protein [Gammaproteobacteria bacterium AqS3]